MPARPCFWRRAVPCAAITQSCFEPRSPVRRSRARRLLAAELRLLSACDVRSPAQQTLASPARPHRAPPPRTTTAPRAATARAPSLYRAPRPHRSRAADATRWTRTRLAALWAHGRVEIVFAMHSWSCDYTMHTERGASIPTPQKVGQRCSSQKVENRSRAVGHRSPRNAQGRRRRRRAQKGALRGRRGRGRQLPGAARGQDAQRPPTPPRRPALRRHHESRRRGRRARLGL